MSVCGRRRLALSPPQQQPRKNRAQDQVPGEGRGQPGTPESQCPFSQKFYSVGSLCGLFGPHEVNTELTCREVILFLRDILQREGGAAGPSLTVVAY